MGIFGNFLGRVSGKALPENSFTELRIKGFHTHLNLQANIFLGKKILRGLDLIPMHPVTLKMQFPDFFFFADLAYQMQSLVIQVTKTPGIDHFQSVETAGDFGQFLLIQKKIGVLISGKIQMIVAECTAAPFAPAAPKKQDLPG